MRNQQKVETEKHNTGVEIEHNRYEEINKIRGESAAHEERS